MRIDSHAHGQPAHWTGDGQAYVDACRGQGIEAIVLIQDVATCLEAVRRFGDFVIPVARLDMNRATVAEMEAALDAGCRGIKFIRPHAPYADERYWPLYEALERRGVTAVFHTGYLMMFEAREERPIRMEHMRAAEINTITRRFPELRILMAHFSNPWWEEAWKICWSRPNVYADLSGGTALHRAVRMWAEMFAPDGNLLESSIRKLCFGSDVSYFEPGPPAFPPYIRFYERLFEALRLPPDIREQVNRGNLLTLFPPR